MLEQIQRLSPALHKSVSRGAHIDRAIGKQWDLFAN